MQRNLRVRLRERVLISGEEKFYTFFELALLHHDQGEHYRKEASVGFIVAGPTVGMAM